MEKKKNKMKIAVSILIGIAIIISSFFIFIIFSLSAIREMLWVLLAINTISLIAFLVLWNILSSKKVFLLLLVQVPCIIIGIVFLQYHFYVQSIPAADEEDIYLWSYMPYKDDNRLAKLNEESKLKIKDNLPVLDGATALYPVYASFAQAVYPEENYDFSKSSVLCSRTNGAYENLFEGKADIIFCAEPSDSQFFISKDFNLKFVPIGREAFVFFVNKENPVSNLTIDDIKGIYSGKIKNWKKLNGLNKSIRVFQRPENSGSQTILKKTMGGVPLIKPRRENVSRGMGSIINQVAVYRNFSNAIGYSFLYYTSAMARNDKIKFLSIEGIYPSRKTIQDNSYPFSDNFYAIYIDDENKNDNIERFIEWILSNQGQFLISETGYIPIGRF
ncbi:MAG: substrate-binding domain-containing protein [Treponema sp.]|nr:substrate-binding domain-containing protein [Treponema sp.]MCL2252246.1 substrate-binding domain-containing protein [Treponema sp.]